jgi:hypothetical protein
LYAFIESFLNPMCCAFEATAAVTDDIPPSFVMTTRALGDNDEEDDAGDRKRC